MKDSRKRENEFLGEDCDENDNNKRHKGDISLRTKDGRIDLKNFIFFASKYFHLPQAKAAVKMCMSQSTFKLYCAQAGIERWPYKKIFALEKKIEIKTGAIGKAKSEKRAKALLNQINEINKKIDRIYGSQIKNKNRIELRANAVKTNATKIIESPKHIESLSQESLGDSNEKHNKVYEPEIQNKSDLDGGVDYFNEKIVFDFNFESPVLLDVNIGERTEASLTSHDDGDFLQMIADLVIFD